MTCKYMSDDEQDICCNPECPYCCTWCPVTEYPEICKYAEEKERDTK